MIFDDFQKTNFAFRGLSDEEPEEKGVELPEDDGDSDLEPDKFEEEEEEEKESGEGSPE